jgi:hypothetical protein
MQDRSSPLCGLPRGAVCGVLRTDRGSEHTDYSARTSENVGRKVMEEGALIDLIDEAIHTDGEQLSDEQVLDYIEQLLKKRGN